jgi:hypothetical protein
LSGDLVTIIVKNPEVPVLWTVDHKLDLDGTSAEALAGDVLTDLHDHAVSPVPMVNDVASLEHFLS